MNVRTDVTSEQPQNLSGSVEDGGNQFEFERSAFARYSTLAVAIAQIVLTGLVALALCTSIATRNP